jgi:anti-sigma B factor antagonist
MSETRETPPPDAPGTAAQVTTTHVASGEEGDDQISVRLRRPAAGQVVLEIGGEVDMLTSPQLRMAALEQLGAGAGVELVVLALDDVTFLGTSGLAVLIEVREAAHAAGVELRLACTARRVLRPLAIAGLVPLFDIHPTVDEALVET